MKKLIINILFILIAYPLIAQNGYEPVLNSIETNSTTLSALREQMEAQKLNNRTGIYLSNPEVEFGYLWGNSSTTGNKTNIVAKQSFDFPTAYSHRNNISKLANVNTELAYKSERINLLLSAKQTCIELVYYNALAKEYAVRLNNAERIANTYKIMFEKGEANIIENNKAQLNLTTVRNEVERIETERLTLLSELRRMNGGIDIQFSDNAYSSKILPPNFDEWYRMAESKSPALQYISGQIEISKKEISLSKAEGLPKLSVGYMSEQVKGGEGFRGVTVGISIPLWENKNRVKQAKAEASAAESTLKDNKVQFYNKLQNLYLKASNLQQSALKYRNSLSSYNNDILLKKALEAGEISLLNYLLEIEYYYDAINNILETEKNMELTIAELSAVEL